MGFRSLFSVSAAAALSCSCAWAATFSVLVFESGIRHGAPMIEASSAWESGLMDELFDGGNIVTNADTARLSKPGLPSSSYGLAEARLGGAEFLVQVVLEYEPSTDQVRPSPAKVIYRICDGRGETLFQEQKHDLLPTKSGSEDEKNARKVARILIGRMKKDR